METSDPLISVIVPTKNSQKFLDTCLKSVKDQTYKEIELIVVDNFSNDRTLEIARQYADRVYQKGPERSAQVNFGVEQAKGGFIYKVDSDFLLHRDIIKECVQKIREGFDAVIIHNAPDEQVSWIAKIRKFEIDMYKFDFTHSSARFVDKEVFKKIGGFNERITAGEDYDFQNRLNREGYRTGFIDAEAVHLDEPISFWKHMKKYYDYGRNFVYYCAENREESKKQLSFFRGVYFRNWRKFLRHPILGASFFIYNFLKYVAGGLGYVWGWVRGR